MEFIFFYSSRIHIPVKSQSISHNTFFLNIFMYIGEYCDIVRLFICAHIATEEIRI